MKEGGYSFSLQRCKPLGNIASLEIAMDAHMNELTVLTQMTLSWFVVCTAPRHEKRVAERISDHGLEVFLPVAKVRREWNKRRPVELEMPLFSGYVFARVDHGRRGTILATPGVTAIVGNRREALTVPDDEMNALRTGLSLYAPEPHSPLAVGDRVRIQAGPLAGLEGILIRKKSTVRVVITVKAIMRAVSLEIDATHLTPIREGCPSLSVQGTMAGRECAGRGTRFDSMSIAQP